MAAFSNAVPSARIDHLIITEAGAEVLVYDQSAHHIHHLNKESFSVWRLCDGQGTVGDIAIAAGMSEELVTIALLKLANVDLLEGELPALVRGATGSSRRRFLKRAAVAGAVPVVVSMSAPAAVASESCDMDGCSVEDVGKPCGVGPQSCSELTCRISSTSGIPYCGY